jgi:hypothetical protein
MTCRVGFVWDSRQHFCRFIEDTGLACELVTSQMLAAPFFRPSISCLIIPTGFANPQFSNLLPALRASADRIERFVQNGGNLLVFGAAVARPDAYDWLPFPVLYHHDYQTRSVACPPGSTAATLINDYDAGKIECDGFFSGHGCTVAGTSKDQPVILEHRAGSGIVVITSVHEYPSRAFLTAFCQSGTQTLF